MDIMIESKDRDISLVRLNGALNARSTEEVRQVFMDLSSRGVKRFIVDLENVPFIDSGGLAALVHGLKISGGETSNFILVSAQAQARLLFELTMFDRVFEIYDNIDEVPNEQDENEIDPEEEFIAIGEFDGKIRLVLLGQDGTYRFIDGTQQIHNILYIVTSELLAMKEAVEELEYWMNHPKAKERDFQDFFERNPKLILNDEYKKAHPHITLTREEGPLIPDFLLEPIEQNALVDILDLKLPTTRIFVLKKSRMRFSAAVMEACAQLREYRDYFDEKENRELIYRNYGLRAYKPKMIIIIGRRGDIDPIAARKIESDIPQLVLRTYDDVLNRAKTRLKEMQ